MRTLYEVSFAGSIVNIDGINIRDFIDDANPVDIQDTETANIEWSCNGRMIRTIKPSAIILSVSVIPNSPSDHALQSLWKRNFLNGGSVSIYDSNRSLRASITVGNPRGGTYLFSGGTCLSGSPAVTSNGQGKMGGNTYTFAFENVV